MNLTKDELETYEERVTYHGASHRGSLCLNFMAICTIDGGLTEAEAKEIAIKQILEDRQSWR